MSTSTIDERPTKTCAKGAMTDLKRLPHVTAVGQRRRGKALSANERQGASGPPSSDSAGAPGAGDLGEESPHMAPECMVVDDCRDGISRIQDVPREGRETSEEATDKVAITAFDRSAIPPSLRERPQWVSWRPEVRDEGGTQKTTKIPIDPKNGRNAKTNDQATWGTFEQALGYAEYHEGVGIGFVFGDDRSFTGVDLDHVLGENGELAGAYRRFVHDAGTYTEISPSGDGLHLVFVGAKPDGATACNKSQPDGCKVEMYDRSRFFTVTGHVLVDKDGVRLDDPREAPEVLRDIYDTFIGTADVDGDPSDMDGPRTSRRYRGGSFPDDEVLEFLFGAIKGELNRKLWEGDLSSAEGDHSRADEILCCKLVYYTRHNSEQVDHLFRQSGLYRPKKWNEIHERRRGRTRTYGEMTVDWAMRHVKFDFNPDGGPGPFFIDSDGILWRRDEKRGDRVVTTTPPTIVADLRDVDSGEILSLVRVDVAGRSRTIALKRGQLFSNLKIVEALGPFGANVSTANARDIVEFVTYEDRDADRPTVDYVSKLGWVGEPLGDFMPYDRETADVHFQVGDGRSAFARAFMEPRGTLSEWARFFGPLRDASPGLRTMLAAGFASPLLGVFGLRPFLVYAWGSSGSGKTAALKAAGSIWGDPTEGGSYLRTFNDTPKALIKTASVLSDFPLILDELQAKGSMRGQRGKQDSAEALIYDFALGQERLGLNSDRSFIDQDSWRNIVIATGEIPILTNATQQGARNRVLEVEVEPFEEPGAGRSIHNFVRGQFGTAGRALILGVRELALTEHAGNYESVREHLATGHPNCPQADFAAALACADAYASTWVFGEGIHHLETALEDSIDFADWILDRAGDGRRDTDEDALGFIYDWLQEYETNFNTSLLYSGPHFGVRDSVLRTYDVIPSVLRRALEGGNFDYKKTINVMRDRGITTRDNQGNNPTVTVDGRRKRCIRIHEDVLEGYVTGGGSLSATPPEVPDRSIPSGAERGLNGNQTGITAGRDCIVGKVFNFTGFYGEDLRAREAADGQGR